MISQKQFALLYDYSKFNYVDYSIKKHTEIVLFYQMQLGEDLCHKKVPWYYGDQILKY